MRTLVQAKAINKLFAHFDAALTDRGYLAMGGRFLDDGCIDLDSDAVERRARTLVETEFAMETSGINIPKSTLTASSLP